MPCLPRNLDDAAALVNEEGDEAVAQVVRACALDPRCFGRGREAAPPPIAPVLIVPRLSIGAAEHERAVPVGWARLAELLEVVRERTQQSDGSTRARLRWFQVAVGERRVDADRPCGDLFPLKCERFSGPQTRVRENGDQRGVAESVRRDEPVPQRLDACG